MTGLNRVNNNNKLQKKVETFKWSEYSWSVCMWDCHDYHKEFG